MPKKRFRDVRVNKALPGYSAGTVVPVECDDAGVPLEEFWRRRLNDAKIDGCCELVQPAETPVKRSRKKTREENENG